MSLPTASRMQPPGAATSPDRRSTRQTMWDTSAAASSTICKARCSGGYGEARRDRAELGAQPVDGRRGQAQVRHRVPEAVEVAEESLALTQQVLRPHGHGVARIDERIGGCHCTILAMALAQIVANAWQ